MLQRFLDKSRDLIPAAAALIVLLPGIGSSESGTHPDETLYLTIAEQIDNMPTCAIFTANFAIDDWEQLEWKSGQDAEFDYPRNRA